MSLDIPDQVRKTVIADGNESWLDELPGVVDSLAREWSLMIGSSFAGGHAALVVEVTLVDGTPADLGDRRIRAPSGSRIGCSRVLSAQINLICVTGAGSDETGEAVQNN